MRILYLDIDTLRPDHLGCYGYRRNTSPNLDRLAAGGVRFENCYASDVPCLPSRAAMFTGQWGIRNGVVNHGGLAADRPLIGRARAFNTHHAASGPVFCLRRLGYYPVSFSPFAERHSAWWWCEGWQEMHNSGGHGSERAEQIAPAAIDWIARNARRDNWLLHVNLWDPHTPYRTPADFARPFAGEPIDGWYTEEHRRRQWESFGPGGPQEPGGSMGRNLAPGYGLIRSMADYRRWIDGYDSGIAYADHWCGRILDALADQGVLDDTAVIVTSDHGEAFGELGVIGDHQSADHSVSRVPMIVRWPGVPGSRTDAGLHCQGDLFATVVELLGGKVPAHWDARGFAGAFRAGQPAGRDALVLSQCAWSCQRSARWDNWLYLRTYHTGLKNWPERMLFDLAGDPHEEHDLAAARPDLAARGQEIIDRWQAAMMAASPTGVDPLETVLGEGGPYHTRDEAGRAYLEYLKQTGRGRHAEFLGAHPAGLPR